MAIENNLNNEVDFKFFDEILLSVRIMNNEVSEFKNYTDIHISCVYSNKNHELHIKYSKPYISEPDYNS